MNLALKRIVVLLFSSVISYCLINIIVTYSLLNPRTMTISANLMPDYNFFINIYGWVNLLILFSYILIFYYYKNYLYYPDGWLSIAKILIPTTSNKYGLYFYYLFFNLEVFFKLIVLLTTAVVIFTSLFKASFADPMAMAFSIMLAYCWCYRGVIKIITYFDPKDNKKFIATFLVIAALIMVVSYLILQFLLRITAEINIFNNINSIIIPHLFGNLDNNKLKIKLLIISFNFLLINFFIMPNNANKKKLANNNKFKLVLRKVSYGYCFYLSGYYLFGWILPMYMLVIAAGLLLICKILIIIKIIITNLFITHRIKY